MSFKSLLVFNNHGGSNEREAVTDGSAIVILVIEWTNLYTYVTGYWDEKSYPT